MARDLIGFSACYRAFNITIEHNEKKYIYIVIYLIVNKEDKKEQNLYNVFYSFKTI